MLKKNEPVYVAGPMTYIKSFNFPAFDAATRDLRSQGYTVVSPAELDDPKVRAAAMASPDGAPGSGSPSNETWGDFLKRDVKLVADEVGAIAVLPGWEKSRGARLETFVGYQLCGKPVVHYPSLRAVSKRQLMKAWLGELYSLCKK